MRVQTPGSRLADGRRFLRARSAAHPKPHPPRRPIRRSKTPPSTTSRRALRGGWAPSMIFHQAGWFFYIIGIIGVMDVFTTRYKALNLKQKQAVDTIDGPLLVIAGPGTGKTELLSMRAANILKATDTLPENILCLTFTDSGANAMRERLRSIIGPDAYKVAIHTFHSFGMEIMSHNREYFYHGAETHAADELATYEILRGIFDELDFSNPLSSKNNDQYTYLSEARTVISELKRAGLSSDELLEIVRVNEAVLDSVEGELREIFAEKISTKLLPRLAPVAEQVASLTPERLPPGLTPLSNVLALSMAHAFDAAVEINKTTPITAWRNEWMEKNSRGEFVFKSRKRHAKLRSLAHVYFTYLSRMEQAQLYDYDDMILHVVHALETQPDLRFNLQEKYHYMMVDEFQDTNLAQLRILFNLTDTPTGDAPNVMAVGDDDQAIYSFQGADVNNIHRFREQYPSGTLLSLKDNYRSAKEILEPARSVVTQGQGRLEDTIESLNKQLTSHHTHSHAAAQLVELSSVSDERQWVAEQIAQHIKKGMKPETITVIARTHKELIQLSPYLSQQNILLNYERRDNVLELPIIQAIELLSRIVVALASSQHDIVDSLLPELLAHPAFSYDPAAIWKLSLTSYREKQFWMETMANTSEFQPLHAWLISLAAKSQHTPLEYIIDEIVGIPTEEERAFTSPLYSHYFGDNARDKNPDEYITMLDALRTIRTHLRGYNPANTHTLATFVEFVKTYKETGQTMIALRRPSDMAHGAVNLMTAHNAKGLEFDTVYIIGCVDTTWGERVRVKHRMLGYPENLPLESGKAANYSERVRLFYVAMTRARNQLVMTYSTQQDTGKAQLIASFLSGTSLTPKPATPADTTTNRVEQAEVTWHDTLAQPSQATMQQLLAPTLERYKLSATHLNNFIDLTRGGPTAFLLNNLLRFPQAKSASAGYGTAIHAALQRAHNHLAATGDRRPIEDVIGDFYHELSLQQLSSDELKLYRTRGADALRAFLDHSYDSFSQDQHTEVSFGGQGVTVGDAKLTGALDMIEIKDKAIHVTDYKTGKPSRDWKGKTEYEKIKLHKYKQQLLFYELLCKNARDFARFEFNKGTLQFVEPDTSGDIHALTLETTDVEREQFIQLISAVWHCITTLDFPDTSEFEPTYKGIIAFEQSLIDKYSNKK